MTEAKNQYQQIWNDSCNKFAQTKKLEIPTPIRQKQFTLCYTAD